MLLADCAIGRCCKLRLVGSAKQIEDILLSSEWNPSLKDIWIPSVKELVEQCRKYRAIPVELDRADKPKGIAIPMNLVIRAREDLDSVLRKLRSGENKISLDLALDWDLGKELASFLRRPTENPNCISIPNNCDGVFALNSETTCRISGYSESMRPRFYLR